MHQESLGSRPAGMPQLRWGVKIISFIDDAGSVKNLDAQLIRRILEHLNLWKERIPKGLPPPVEHEDIADVVVCEAFDNGWGRYEETDDMQH